MATPVRSALADGRAIIAHLHKDMVAAQRQALRLLALLADILAAALLLDEARADQRKSLIARLFIESHFTAESRGSFPERDWLYRQFKELTEFPARGTAAE
jgi:hypothetical protein